MKCLCGGENFEPVDPGEVSGVVGDQRAVQREGRGRDPSVFGEQRAAGTLASESYRGPGKAGLFVGVYDEEVRKEQREVSLPSAIPAALVCPELHFGKRLKRDSYVIKPIQNRVVKVGAGIAAEHVRDHVRID